MPQKITKAVVAYQTPQKPIRSAPSISDCLGLEIHATRQAVGVKAQYMIASKHHIKNDLMHHPHSKNMQIGLRTFPLCPIQSY